jgi:glutamine cyclotransferase
MKKRQLLILLAALTVLVVSAVLLTSPTTEPPGNSEHGPVNYSYRIVNVYPHDPTAFTEGLVIDNGVLYESTGIRGASSLRRVELETGEVLQSYSLPPQYFGEGITLFDDKIIQLTWQSNKGFVYDEKTFALLQEFSYSTEGWGVTTNGSQLIMSDGSSTLFFLDPETFQKTGQVEVHDNSTVEHLNELEYIQGKIYANIWLEEKIAIINPQTGQVEGWINMSGLQNMENQDPDNVLNGIAYDAASGRLFVTGKRWSQLFEIKLVPEE